MIQTCNDLEEWIKTHARHRVDGTFQHAAFEFIAFHRATDMERNTVAIAALLVNGIPAMDEHGVDAWLKHFREECASQVMPSLFFEFPVNIFEPVSARIERKVDDVLETMLLHYFGLTTTPPK